MLRSWVRLANTGHRPVTVQSVTSFLVGRLLPRGQKPRSLDELDLLWADNDWLAEGRWQRGPLRDALARPEPRRAHGARPRGRVGLTSQGTWSSGAYLPMGALLDRRTGQAWAWQIEHNGGWHWQVGEAERAATWPCSGPPTPSITGAWPWRPARRFSTVPATVAVSAAGFEGAVGDADRGPPGGPAAAPRSPAAAGDLQ